MRKPSTCFYCQHEFDGPAPCCPRCGGPVADAGFDGLGEARPAPAANDDALEIPEVGEGEFVVVPVGVDDATLLAPPAPRPRTQPPPLPRKKIALA